ncbi:hypothetical protein CCHR01_17097 [Colletotrichum chrysophilum]|uniref:Uncharacterized protein n=1 Tax=Colletotrichum chrysophilum TaxID=1836956 RepID=A0AAD9EA86_9PEZI|nr:hypothetical protein CCHR01_17097 [Colletotrichum chrysophilum]
MAIVWCRLASTPRYQPERCTVDSNGEGRRPVPRPTLAVFLLYAPHFFRFHEEHGPAACVHIFRYTHSLYAADADHDEDAFYIAKTDINQSKILQIVGDLHLQEEDWLEIVPPSFEGSLLTMPNHYGHIAPRSEETKASLMLPDVYTLGLPDYRNNKMKGHGLVTRNILAHKRWVPSHVLSDGAVTKKYKGRKYLKMSALRRYSDDKCPQLWISPKLTANLLTEKDKSLLHRLLADLEGDSGVPRCLRPFKNAIDPFEEAPTKTSIAALIQEMGQSAETAMNRITEFGNGDQQGEPAFVKHIMKPYCMLLDIDYPGTPVEGHRAIVQSDLDVGMDVSAIMYLRMLPGTGDLRDAVQKLKGSNRFKSTWRFLLFKDRLSGIEFDEGRKHLWQKVFGEPFERV